MIAKRFHPPIEDIAPLVKMALSEGKSVKLAVTGYSMYPLLRSITDCVLLEGAENLKKYDIVLFEREDGTYILHRIIKRKGDVLTIAGDNETKREYPVKVSSCIGKVTAFWRKDKYYSVNVWWNMVYQRVWLFVFPVRKPLVKLYHAITNMIRRINKKRKQGR
ncbi:MAG: S24 family peptidase [Ruminococcaceae bacterium]|nr:S24 family peptidase [Oscillospiraceae bacterium]